MRNRSYDHITARAEPSILRQLSPVRLATTSGFPATDGGRGDARGGAIGTFCGASRQTASVRGGFNFWGGGRIK